VENRNNPRGFLYALRIVQIGHPGGITAEMMIHFSGLENIDNPGVPAFPRVSICLHCGASRFTMAAIELALLTRRNPTGDRRAPSWG
jgi:hypothetical protein